MKKSLTEYSLAFLGTSDRSIPILDALHASIGIKLCITKNDTRVGRKQEIRQTAVKTWAEKNNVDCLTINSLKDNDLTNVLVALQEQNIKLGVVADFGYIIPSKIISTFPLGLINIHFSLLPKYRGASPIQHAILHNETTTGVTFMLADNGMDTGPILHQLTYSMQGNETSSELYIILFRLAGQTISQVVTGYLMNKYVPVGQNANNATYCYSPTHPKSTYIYKEDAKIDWNKSLEQISRETRAYFDWPISWAVLSELQDSGLAFTRDGIVNTTKNNKGEFMLKKTLKLAGITIKIFPTSYVSGCMKINEIQVSGKNKMFWAEFLNGYCEKIAK